MKAFNLLALFTLFLSHGAFSKSVMITVYGGQYECSAWIEKSDSIKTSDKLSAAMSSMRQSAWLAGYMTAYNSLTGETNFQGANAAVTMEFVQKYCSKNPSKTVDDAIDEMIKKLKK